MPPARKSTAKKKSAKKKPARTASAPPAIGPLWTLTRGELATALEVELTTVDQWRRRGVPSSDEKGSTRFRLAAVVEWLRKRDADQARQADATIDLERLRKRKALADTERAELELAQLRAEVAEIAIVEELVGAEYDTVRAKLNSIPGRYSSRLARIKTAPLVRKALTALVAEVLHELSSSDELAGRATATGTDRGGGPGKPRRKAPARKARAASA